jgi:hypothetical protein
MKGFLLQYPTITRKLARFRKLLTQLELQPNAWADINPLKHTASLAFCIFRQISQSPWVQAMKQQSREGLSCIYRLSQVARYVQVAHNIMNHAQKHPNSCRNAQIVFLEPYPEIYGRWVHAEIQLLLHYELSGTKHWPRAIGSSTAACYQCRKVIQFHKFLTILQSHGRICSLWTLPNVSFPSEDSLHRVISAFNELNRHLNDLIGVDEQFGSSGNKLEPHKSARLMETAYREPTTSTANFMSPGLSARALRILAQDTHSTSSSSTISEADLREGDNTNYNGQKQQTYFTRDYNRPRSRADQAWLSTPLPAEQTFAKGYYRKRLSTACVILKSRLSLGSG